MYYYLLALLKNNTPLLTYASKEKCEIFSIVSITLRNKAQEAVIIKEVQKPSFACKMLEPLELSYTSLQKHLASFIAKYYCASYSDTFSLFVPKKNILPFMQDNLESNLQMTKTPLSLNLNPLNSIQQEALQFCLTQNFTLLFGDTGSGKTEIFFHLIKNALEKNQTTLLLMPEISLTPQIERRLKKAFGDIFVLWHSKLTKKKKKSNLEKILNHEAKIIAGARSALFLPLESLGLIIVDEEHDDAYKSQKKPLYNARDLCLFLSKNADIRVVLASATPSVSSYFLAKKNHSIFRIKGNFHQTQKTFIFDRSVEMVSPALLSYLQQNLMDKKQSIIFVPTRANFKTLVCQDCGQIITCDHCSIAMSVHVKKNLMLCHYCNFSIPIPKECPYCKSKDFVSNRIGTAQLKIELQNILPDAKIEIFDKDHAQTSNKMNTILQSLKNYEIDILIGTQMIAKGHDYPNVSLSVILGIDYTLKGVDFRSTEKAFQLLYQVAGRSGRVSDGKVFIQSLNPTFLQKYLTDYEDFLFYEKQNRKELYPPYKKLILLLFNHKNESKAKEDMEFILQILEGCNSQSFSIIGAQKNLIEKIANVFRYHILLRVHQIIPTLKIIQQLQKQYPLFEIDVDPIDFY
ncbi:primosomal protein N' [Helicobacter sp. faydin-H20]|uniref:primosomal protein N' n=1 Tax=Helicobacter anatolicus TaxID=2905874 RepID=UPI001E65ADC5|nr:primosomal protein N' [Helicobacter anatolicus]MCE3037142.1 primosomal protein N' [Helicobacter anatolicus]